MPGFRRSRVLRLLGALAAFCAAGLAAAGTDPAVDSRVRDAASRLWFHGVNDEIARTEVGPEGVPVLLELLADPSFSRRDNVVAFLAHLEGPGITEGLVAFLENPPGDPSVPEEDRALLLAPAALGRAAARGDAAAEAALRAIAGDAEEANPVAAGVRRGAYGAPLRRDLVQEAARALARPTPATTELAPPGGGSGGTSTLATDPSTAIHDAAITYANHPDNPSPMTAPVLDQAFQHVRAIAGRADFVGDVACCTTLSRSGTGKTFGTAGDGLDRVDDETEGNQVLSQTVARVKVVRTISWCGSPGTNIAGCAYRPGGSMMVIRLSTSAAEGVLWLHEYGHNTGLEHNADSRYVMYASLNLNDPNDGLSSAECSRYHSPMSPTTNPVTSTGECHDRDADDWASSADNCPDVSNPDQQDLDGDGIGDACESVVVDSDGDGITDASDNCPDVFNPTQTNRDGDALGDACDPCTDADADGFGSPGAPGCSGGASTDCDDTRASVHPGAPDLCDGRDNDCDGDLDELLCEELDVNGDVRVDGHELAWLGRAFGASSGTPDAEWWFPVDYDRDGDVDGDDLAVLAAGWVCTAGTPVCP